MKNKKNSTVISIAGFGSCIFLTTKAIPKKMLSIVDKPLIQYVVEAVEAGIKNIILVMYSSKSALENHFDKIFELEAQLEKRVKGSLLEEVRKITAKGTKVINMRQFNALCFGLAISC